MTEAVTVAAISLDDVDALDRTLRAFKDAAAVPLPAQGWLKAIRNALAMSVDQLAARVGMTPAALAELEEAEASGHAPLRDVVRVAAALDCKLVYGLVPQGTLKDLIEQQVRKIAQKRVGYMEELMRQHGHSLDAKEIGHHVEEFSRIILTHIPGSLWDHHLVDESERRTNPRR